MRARAYELAAAAAKHKRYVSKRVLASFLGLGVSLSPAIPAGRFNLLPLYDALTQVSGWAKTAMVRLSNQAYRRLKDFWTRLTVSACHVSWDVSSPREWLFTDASDFAAGAHTTNLTVDGLMSVPWDMSDIERHITFKELKAV